MTNLLGERRGDNSAVILDELAERASRLYAQSVDDWLECGRVLLEAREIADHGKWLKLLEHADIPVRVAQKMMRLARAGIKCELATHLGGVDATLEALSRVEGWGESRVAALGGIERALLLVNAMRRARGWAKAFIESAESTADRGAILQSWPDGPISAGRWLDFVNKMEDVGIKTGRACCPYPQ